MDPVFAAELTKYGLPGLAILALGWAFLKKDAKVDELNEKRIAEARESIKTIEQNTGALESLSELIRDRK